MKCLSYPHNACMTAISGALTASTHFCASHRCRRHQPGTTLRRQSPSLGLSGQPTNAQAPSLSVPTLCTTFFSFVQNLQARRKDERPSSQQVRYSTITTRSISTQVVEWLDAYSMNVDEPVLSVVAVCTSNPRQPPAEL